jgi:hypothetical protein
VGFPQYGFKLRHHAVRSGAFRHDGPPLSPIPDIPAASHAFTPAFETRARLPGSPPLCADLWRCASHLSPEVLAPEGLCCPFLPRLVTSSASLETSASLPSMAGYSGGLWHSRVLLPGLHTFRTSATVLSRIAAFSFRRESGTCTPILPYQRWPSGRGKKPLATPMLPQISFPWGPNFDGLSVRSRYGPPGCSPPGLIGPRTQGVLSPPEACTSGLPALKSPRGLPDMTTAPNGELRRQDFHLQVQQLVSLRSLPWVPWASVPHLPRYYATLRLPPCPSRVASLVARFPIPCVLLWFVVSPQGSLPGRSAQPAPGLLVTRSPHSGYIVKETDGSPKFPSSPCEDMPRSQTPGVSCALAIPHPGLLPSGHWKPSAFLSVPP